MPLIRNESGSTADAKYLVEIKSSHVKQSGPHFCMVGSVRLTITESDDVAKTSDMVAGSNFLTVQTGA